MKLLANKFVVGGVVLGLAIALLVGVPHVLSQEKKAEGKPAAEKAEVKKEAPAKERAEPKGRLPNFYGDVVSGDQREKIYAIQAKYDVEISKLQEQLKAVMAKRNAEVEAVLTPEQREKVAKAAADAKAKAAAAAEAKKKEAEAAPAVKVIGVPAPAAVPAPAPAPKK